MIRTLYTGANGMIGQQLQVDTISNNLANVNTVGFKKVGIEFQDLLYETLQPAGSQTGAGNQIPTGLFVGHGSKPAATFKVHQQGSLLNTGNQLDVAIEGKGFFQVTDNNGDTAYTRDGAFKVDSNGDLVTADGFKLTDSLNFPDGTTDIFVGGDGTVTANVSGTLTSVGNITLARFVNDAGLQSAGRNLLKETDASGTATTGTPDQSGYGALVQGFLEASNVQVVEEMVNLIISQRAYEMSSKSITTADQMMQIAGRLR